jgi:hypothetical protein
MNNFPPELKRHVFKLMLDENPLEIFDFSKKMFKIGEYKKGEKQRLIMDCIEKSFEKSKVALFNFKPESENFNIYRKENFLSLLYSIKGYINDSNINLFCNKYTFFFIDESIVEILGLKILKFIYSINPLLVINSSNRLLEYSSSNFKIIKWLTQINIPQNDIKISLIYAIENNNLKFIKYFINHFEIGSSCSSVAAFHNNFKILKLLYRNKIKLNDDCLAQAIKNNNLEMAKWIYERNKNSYIDAWSFNYAISENNLETLEWLKSINTPDCEEIKELYKVAVYKNNLDILEWLIKSYPSVQCDRHECYGIAIQNGNLKIANYIGSLPIIKY